MMAFRPHNSIFLQTPCLHAENLLQKQTFTTLSEQSDDNNEAERTCFRKYLFKLRQTETKLT